MEKAKSTSATKSAKSKQQRGKVITPPGASKKLPMSYYKPITAGRKKKSDVPCD